MTVQHNVLIVDDHRITQSGLRFLFGSLDRFVVVDALDCGAMVNAFVQSQPIDLVILDLNLPDVRGISRRRPRLSAVVRDNANAVAGLPTPRY